jgi:hypothetical protein
MPDATVPAFKSLVQRAQEAAGNAIFDYGFAQAGMLLVLPVHLQSPLCAPRPLMRLGKPANANSIRTIDEETEQPGEEKSATPQKRPPKRPRVCGEAEAYSSRQ